MDRILSNTTKTAELFATMPKIYVVARWLGCGVLDFPCTNKVGIDPITKQSYPLVYVYDDHNGESDQFELRRLDLATSGWIVCWTYSKEYAERVAKALNQTWGKNGW